MEDGQNGLWPKWIMAKIEDCQNGRFKVGYFRKKK